MRSQTLNTVSGIATYCSGTKAERATKLCKAREVLISQTCNNAYKNKKGSTDLTDLSLNRWLDDMAIQHGVNRDSCQVTVIVVVTDIDVSPTGFRNFNGDLTLGTLFGSRFSWRLTAIISGASTNTVNA